MHPLMNRFHADEQRRLMELLGVKESSVPLLSRRSSIGSSNGLCTPDEASDGPSARTTSCFELLPVI